MHVSVGKRGKQLHNQTFNDISIPNDIARVWENSIVFSLRLSRLLRALEIDKSRTKQYNCSSQERDSRPSQVQIHSCSENRQHDECAHEGNEINVVYKNAATFRHWMIFKIDCQGLTYLTISSNITVSMSVYYLVVLFMKIEKSRTENQQHNDCSDEGNEIDFCQFRTPRFMYEINKKKCSLEANWEIVKTKIIIFNPYFNQWGHNHHRVRD